MPCWRGSRYRCAGLQAGNCTQNMRSRAVCSTRLLRCRSPRHSLVFVLTPVLPRPLLSNAQLLILPTNARQFRQDQASDGGTSGSAACDKHLLASALAASATGRSCFCLGPSLDSSVAPVSRNSIQFSRRSFANTNTTCSNCSLDIPACCAAAQNFAFNWSPLSKSSSRSAQTISVVLPPIVRQLRSSAGILSIRSPLPPQSTGRMILLPVHGRIHAGLSAFSSARIKIGSMLRPFFPSWRQTI
jgi:hypothetical protein